MNQHPENPVLNRATLLLILGTTLALGTVIGIGVFQREGMETQTLPLIATGGAPPFRFVDPTTLPVTIDDFGRPEPATRGENLATLRAPIRSEVKTITLEADQAIEIKAMMQQGDSLVYEWSVDRGQVYWDFHAHQPDAGPDFFTRYSEGEGARDAGMILAPYAGQHGWYWLNLEGRPVTVTLTLHGGFDEVVEIPLDQDY